jgi:hypothetical protein
MNEKDYLTNKSFCPLPWTGFVIESDGTVKNCICSFGNIGNIKELKKNNKGYFLSVISDLSFTKKDI